MINLKDKWFSTFGDTSESERCFRLYIYDISNNIYHTIDLLNRRFKVFEYIQQYIKLSDKQVNQLNATIFYNHLSTLGYTKITERLSKDLSLMGINDNTFHSNIRTLISSVFQMPIIENHVLQMSLKIIHDIMLSRFSASRLQYVKDEKLIRMNNISSLKTLNEYSFIKIQGLQRILEKNVYLCDCMSIHEQNARNNMNWCISTLTKLTINELIKEQTKVGI